jgi:hypothetical protein
MATIGSFWTMTHSAPVGQSRKGSKTISVRCKFLGMARRGYALGITASFTIWAHPPRARANAHDVFLSTSHADKMEIDDAIDDVDRSYLPAAARHRMAAA